MTQFKVRLGSEYLFAGDNVEVHMLMVYEDFEGMPTHAGRHYGQMTEEGRLNWTPYRDLEQQPVESRLWRPTMRLPREVLPPLTDALIEFMALSPANDTRLLRADYEKARERLDAVTDRFFSFAENSAARQSAAIERLLTEG